MEIYPDFKELFESLNAHKVDYLVVGGYAMAFHGAPRVTGDIDLLVRPNADNADRIIAALKDFGFESPDLTAEDFQNPDRVIQLGVPPVRVDLITSLTAVSWEQADSGKLLTTYGDVQVSYIGKAQLLANKKALGRKKDLADIEALDQTS